MTKDKKPTPAQRKMLENLRLHGPDEYCATAHHPKLRSGRESVAETCAKRGWVTIARSKMFFRVVTITPAGLEVLS